MATFDFLIDTKPMADSMGTVSNHVLATTAAVTAMQAAVIKTENDAAEHICRNVDRGFYNLMRSRMSMKLSESFTLMNAKMVLLMEYSKALMQTKSRMESDVNRLRREYYKTFHGLDKALENRIFQLDKEAMRFGDIRTSLIKNRVVKDVSSMVCMQNDTTKVMQLSVSARMKNKTSASLGSISNNISEQNVYNSQVEKILEQDNIETAKVECVPVIYRKSKSTAVVNSDVTEYFFPEYMSKATKEIIEANINQQIDNIVNVNNKKLNDEVQMEFQKLIAERNVDPRVAQTMMQLQKNGVI